MPEFEFPSFAKNRGVGFWLRFGNLWSNRSFIRTDDSNLWRYTYGPSDPHDRSKSYSDLLDPDKQIQNGFKFIVLGDTGEGDQSQYSLLPLLNYLKPDFMIIIGDLANPGGRIDKNNNRDKDDYLAGFFEPYKNFNIPIWSVPGNHEFYSPGQGKEYFDTFCSLKYASRWSQYGLRFVKQPGTYWEISQPGVKNTIIGIDTGKTGKLDGLKRPWKTWLPDHKQHQWLEERLTKADRDSKEVMVLLHIPALRKQKRDKKVRLSQIHKIMASHRCVRHIICGHEHNFQLYSPETFAHYMQREFDFQQTFSQAAKYVINGGGGSALHSTVFKKKRYSLVEDYYTPFPSEEQWRYCSNLGVRAVAKVGLDRTLLGRIASLINKDAMADGDEFRYLSFLLVEVKDQGEKDLEFDVRAVYMENLQDLFSHIPDQIIDIRDKNPNLQAHDVEQCTKGTI